MTSQLLAVVTLETEDLPNYIHIYEDDDIELLIDAFCELNQIQEVGKLFIISEIKNKLKQINRTTLDIQIKSEYRDQQSFNKNNQDLLINNQQMCQQQNNHTLLNTTNNLNLIEQQYDREILNSNQNQIKQVTSPNFRYEKTSQIINQRQKTILDVYTKEKEQQEINKRKNRIFDNEQPKIKYKQDLKLIRDIFRQLDNDGDGYISSEQINQTIKQQILQQIAPVLFHMQEQRMVLDFDSFVYLLISFNILIY